MSAVEEIRTKLENRLILCEQEIESLRTALDALDHEQATTAAAAAPTAAAPAAAAPARPARRRANGSGARPANGARRASPTRTAAKPAADGPSSAELERLLAETGGLSAVELARQTGTDYGEVLARIRQLEQAGQSRR